MLGDKNALSVSELETAVEFDGERSSLIDNCRTQRSVTCSMHASFSILCHEVPGSGWDLGSNVRYTYAGCCYVEVEHFVCFVWRHIFVQ